jgi:hypothetical protein
LANASFADRAAAERSISAPLAHWTTRTPLLRTHLDPKARAAISARPVMVPRATSSPNRQATLRFVRFPGNLCGRVLGDPYGSKGPCCRRAFRQGTSRYLLGKFLDGGVKLERIHKTLLLAIAIDTDPIRAAALPSSGFPSDFDTDRSFPICQHMVNGFLAELCGVANPRHRYRTTANLCGPG